MITRLTPRDIQEGLARLGYGYPIHHQPFIPIRSGGIVMSYLEDTIDWQTIDYIDRWLDTEVSDAYKVEPMAQDWARVSKVAEELGETINELILMTGQNPRKGTDPRARSRLMEELADTAITAILALQHFTKTTTLTQEILREKIEAIVTRTYASEKRRHTEE